LALGHLCTAGTAPAVRFAAETDGVTRKRDALFDDLFARARELTDDPLHIMLVGLKLLAEMLEDMPEGHPGCIVATAVYQDRLFDRDVQEANRRAMLGWRKRFREIFDAIAEVYSTNKDVDLDELADMVSVVIEGRLITARALGDPKATSQQIMLMRSYVKLLFSPPRA